MSDREGKKVVKVELSVKRSYLPICIEVKWMEVPFVAFAFHSLVVHPVFGLVSERGAKLQ